MVKLLKEMRQLAEPYKFRDLARECERELGMRAEVYKKNPSPAKDSQVRKMERIKRILQALEVADLGGEQQNFID